MSTDPRLSDAIVAHWAPRADLDFIRADLARKGLDDAPLFSVPTPFNTLLWRVVVLTDEGHAEGFDSLLLEEGRHVLLVGEGADRRARSRSDRLTARRRDGSRLRPSVPGPRASRTEGRGAPRAAAAGRNRGSLAGG